MKRLILAAEKKFLLGLSPFFCFLEQIDRGEGKRELRGWGLNSLIRVNRGDCTSEGERKMYRKILMEKQFRLSRARL